MTDVSADAHAERPGGEHRAPHAREDRTAAGVALREGEEQQRHVAEVVGKVLCRCPHADELPAVLALRVGFGGRDARRVDRRPQPAEAVGVDRRDLRRAHRGRRRGGSASSARCHRSARGSQRRGSVAAPPAGSGRASPAASPGWCRAPRTRPSRSLPLLEHRGDDRRHASGLALAGLATGREESSHPILVHAQRGELLVRVGLRNQACFDPVRQRHVDDVLDRRDRSRRACGRRAVPGRRRTRAPTPTPRWRPAIPSRAPRRPRRRGP